MSTFASIPSTIFVPSDSTPELKLGDGMACMQDMPTAGEIASDEEGDMHDSQDQADLECQLYMQDTLDLLEMMPRFFIKAFLEDLGVHVPPPEPGTKTTTFELVDMALQHLHEFMHAGGDVAGVYASLLSLVDDIVSAGYMDNPWAADAEPSTLLDVHRELVSYVDQSLEDEIKLLVAKLDCECLSAVKSQPAMGSYDLTDALLEHLQHRLENEEDLSTDADVIRSFRRRLVDGNDEESDNRGDPEPIEPPPEKKQSSDRPTTTRLLNPLNREQNLALIAQLEAKLLVLPQDIIVDVCKDRQLKWMFPDKNRRSSKKKKRKKTLIDQMGKLALIDHMGKQLRLRVDHRTAVSSAVRQVEDSVSECCERRIKHTLKGAVRPRGRSPENSKRLKAIGVELAPYAVSPATSDAAMSNDEAFIAGWVLRLNTTAE